jgi:putative ABC transport system permease protein
MNRLFQDVRYGLRQLSKQPFYTLIAILTLGIGIGANTAIFTVINTLLFKSLPVANESRLVLLRSHRVDETWDTGGVSYLNFVDWRNDAKSFEAMSIVDLTTATFKHRGEPVKVNAGIVTPDFFDTVGIRSLTGRAFTIAEEVAAGPEGLQTVMLSYSGWQRLFNGDPQIIGQRFKVDGSEVQIIGVTPEGIFPLQKEPIDYWATVIGGGDPRKSGTANASRGYNAYAAAIARLKSGVTVEQANAEMTLISKSLAERFPRANEKRVTSAVQLREVFVKDARATLWLLLGVVGSVLLIACVNVTNLLLARATTRQREIAIRMALGARLRQVAQQFLIESLLLAFAGGLTGLLLSMWLVDGTLALMPADWPRLSGLSLDWRVLLFTSGAVLLTGVFCGFFPAFLSTRNSIADAIKDGGRAAGSSVSRGRLRNALVVAEIAIALTLLLGAGLLVKSLIRLQYVNPGFEIANTLTMQFEMSRDRYRNTEQINQFLDPLTAKIKNLPGVTNASYAQCVPLTPNDNGTEFDFVENPLGQNRKPEARLRFVGAEYFQAMKISVTAGRAFTERDRTDAPRVMLVNEAFVREHFKGENPIGKKLRLGWGGEEPKEIVGIVGDVRHRGLSDQARPEMYVPQAQFDNRGITLIVRTAIDAASLAGPVKKEIAALDPEMPVTEVRTLESWRAETLAAPRFNTFLLGLLALVALTLTVIGLYGVMSYSVSQRTQEIGVRMALGAEPRHILGLVLRQGFRLVLVGGMLGILGAAGLTRLMQQLLFEVSPLDPITYAGATLLLILIALLACYLPAHRATRVDSMVALRCE